MEQTEAFMFELLQPLGIISMSTSSVKQTGFAHNPLAFAMF